MNLRKGKKAALGSAAALLAVLGVAVLLRQEIERAYHLVRLRAERSYLAFIAGAAPESPAGRAVDRYLESRTGKEALFLEYATHLAEEVDYQESPAAVFRRFRGEVMWYDASYAGMPLPTGCVYCENHTVADVVDGLLPRVHGERFTLPGSDGCFSAEGGIMKDETRAWRAAQCGTSSLRSSRRTATGPSRTVRRFPAPTDRARPRRMPAGVSRTPSR